MPDGTQIPGHIYAPPNVYVETQTDTPVQAPIQGVRIPVFIGTGNEVLTQTDLAVVRGSSSSVDQQVPQEDMTGRAVVAILASGEVVLGDFDGDRRLIQVRNYPIVTGDGTGTTATDAASIQVTINGQPDVVLNVQGDRGVLELSTAPGLHDDVRCTYFFNRTDTLITDDVSDQVTADPALIYGSGEEPAGGYDITVDNNELILTIDGVETTISLGTPGVKPAATVVSLINGAASSTSLVASLYTTNFGGTAIQFVADENLIVGAGTANTLLGLTTGDATNRRSTFYTFQGPIVDGSNGGITTTDTGKVTVRVNNVQVIPTSVNGSTRAVTLPFAPAAGSTVTIEYFFNSWQDTFDYLANINLTEITRVGIVPGNSDFVQGADFVLKDDVIVWGTSVLITSGVHTEGSTYFGGDGGQVSALLVDAQTYLEEATPVTDATVSPPVTSRTKFDLPFQPTTGNGRNTPIGLSLFQTVSNNRIDLPTNRPDLVIAYWGFSVEDALQRGPVDVTAVEGTRITLKDPVDVGATVYATFYYNTLVDEEYSLVCDVAGASGIGTYFIQDSNSNDMFTPRFGVKGAALTGITIQFPSGSELTPDVRFESGTDGPVEETVTVSFASIDDTIAKYSVPGSGPYFTIEDASDHARFLIDGTAPTGGGAGIDLARVDGITGLGVSASLLGEEIEYDVASGSTTYDITAGTNDEVSVTVDDVLITSIAAAGTGVNADNYVDALNAFAKLQQFAPFYTAQTRFVGSTVITAGEYDTLVMHYNGAVAGPSGAITAIIPPLTYASPMALATALDGVIAAAVGGLGPAFAGLAINVTVDANSRLRFTLQAATGDIGTFAAGGVITVALVPVVGDQIIFTDWAGNQAALTADTATTPGGNNFDVSSGVAATIAGQIAIAIQDVTNNVASIVTTTGAVGVTIPVVPTVPGTLGNRVVMAESAATPATFTFVQPSGATDLAGGYLEFADAPTLASDFAILAGISVAPAPGGLQTKLLNGDIARRFSVAGGSGALIYDRIILRNRIMPGSGSVAGPSQLAQTELRIEGNNAITETGLQPNDAGLAAMGAVVQPATLFGEVGFVSGQVPTGAYGDARDGQPVVTFFADGGTQPQNNVFKINIDGIMVNVTFTDAAGVVIPAGGTADVPLGPGTIANTILAQLDAAAVAAGLPAGTFLPEGAGIRIVSGTSRVSSAITVGAGNANDVLGFSSGGTAARTEVEPEQIASALMAHHDATVSAKLLSYSSPGVTYFAGLALAGVIRDAANAEFLYLQSQASTVGGLGLSSSIALLQPTVGNGSWLLPGTGINAEVGDGASGEEGFNGYYVTSSDPTDGSGSANTSRLNNGVGQDGVIGQTYRDTVTGLTFTVLAREGGGVYPTGVGATFTFEVRNKVITDSNLPVNTIPGIELLVTNTTGVAVGDTAVVDTIERGGSEPAVGDLYYATYNYQKESFDTGLYTRLATIERVFGATSPEHLLSLAAYVSIINGAVVVGLKQVPKQPNSNQGSITDYFDAVDDVRGVLPGGARLSTLTPLRGDSEELFQKISQHVDLQSSIRLRSERTSIFGVSSGTQPSAAGDLAELLGNTRMRMVYPDIAKITLTDAVNNDKQFLVDGTILSAAMAGNRASPNIDVATPWTRARLLGFDELARILDAVEQNQVAVRGVTILEDRRPAISVRHGLTTDVTNVLTKTPTVMTIADEVQQQTRVTLDRFIGVKFLPGILNQIEGRLTFMLKGLIAAEIIAAFTGVQAQTTSDPTVVAVEAWYQPVFPLLYIIVTFNLRSVL